MGDSPVLFQSYGRSIADSRLLFRWDIIRRFDNCIVLPFFVIGPGIVDNIMQAA